MATHRHRERVSLQSFAVATVPHGSAGANLIKTDVTNGSVRAELKATTLFQAPRGLSEQDPCGGTRFHDGEHTQDRCDGNALPSRAGLMAKPCHQIPV